MKNYFLPVPAVLLFLCTAAGAGTLTNVRQLGDDAFRSGDYPSAAGFYRRVLDSGSSTGEWAEDALKLGNALLYSGDLAGANGILNEFRKRFPARSAGLLPGRIMAAEGRYEEAEGFFNSIIDSTSASPAERAAAGFAVAQLLLRTGSPAGALKYLEELEKTPGTPLPAEWYTTYIYALISSGRKAEAEKILAGGSKNTNTAIAAKDAGVLDLALAVAGNDTAAFEEKWQKLRVSLHPVPDFMVYNTLNQGATAALRAGNSQLALKIWQDAFNFASVDQERRDVLHRIFNIYSGTDPERAADTAMEYRRFFPAATDRAQLLTGAARLLAANGSSSRAIELYELVVSDKDILQEERSDAARDAAAVAEKAGDHSTARRMLELLSRGAASAGERHEAALLFGEYLLRQKNYKEVIQKLRGAVSTPIRTLSGRAAYVLLQALIGDGRDRAALTVAESLRGSDNREYAVFAAFHAARLTGKLGDKKKAREAYLKFTSAFADSRYAPEAAFAAARLAGELGEFPAAAREFRDFAVGYPGNASAALALYHGVRYATLAGEWHLAKEILAVLTSGYPESPARGAALLCLAKHLRSRGYYDEELKLLAATVKLPVAPEFQPDVKLEEARILAARRDPAGAAARAEAMLEEFPAATTAADAAMLAGNMRADLGDYPKAGELFARALSLRPSGIFGDIASGRIADCAFALYGSTRKEEELVKAAGIYRKLAENSVFPEIRIQSYFKSGECRAFLGDIAGAVADYRQVLRCAAALQRDGGSPDPVWSSRAAHLALQLLLDSDLPGRLQLGEDIIREYRQLGGVAAADTEFDALRNEIQKRYLNRER